MAADASVSKTDWSLIRDAASPEAETAQRAMEQVARRYWPAIYNFIRYKGFDQDAAADLTQKFMTDVVIGRRLCETANPDRGRFRSLLMTAVHNFVRQESRPTRARREARRQVALDDAELAGAAADASTPESAFSTTWAAMLVRKVLTRVRDECRRDGLESHWTVFDRRIARPLLLGDDPEPYHSLVDRLDLDNAGQASNMVVTVKRRFARAMMDEVGATVDDPASSAEELADLVRDLERPS